MLEDVFVANNRNVYGDVYGFVRYAKVRDVDKLLKAVNNVSFGQYCVRAVLARFDRKTKRNVVRKDEGVGGEVAGKTGRKAGVEGVGGKGSEGEKSKAELKKVGEMKEGEGGEVLVGSVPVRVRRKEKRGNEGEGVVEGGEKGLDRRGLIHFML
jgi:hypothetical protein